MDRDNSSVFRSIDDSLVRDSFENYMQFNERIEAIKPVVVGKAEIMPNTYDSDSGVCFINVEWYGWKNLSLGHYDYFYFILPGKKKEFIENLDGRHSVIAEFKVSGEKVYIDENKLKLSIDDLEVSINTINFVQEPLETNDEYKSKIKRIITMPLGEVRIEKDKYDINTGTFGVNVEFNTLEEVKVPDIKEFYTFISKDVVGDFYENNKCSVLYGNISYINGEITIDVSSIHILYKGTKIKVFSVLLDSLYFNTEENYEVQVETLSSLCCGKASVLIDKYDKSNKNLPLHIKWNEWIKEYVTSIREQFIEADRELAKSLYAAGNEYSVYVNLKNEKGILSVEKISIINYKGKIEVNFKDVFKSINSQVMDDKVPCSDVCNFDEGNYEIDEKFDFVRGVALVKLNGNYTYINERGQILGLVNKRLMRFINTKGKYGYMDNVDRVTIIKPEYDYIGSFNEGLARININNRWGFVNEQGEMVIKPIYEFGRDFHEGLAAVKIRTIIGTRWGYINKEGQIIISPKFDEAGEFSNGIAYVRIRSILKGIQEGFIYENGEFHQYMENVV